MTTTPYGHLATIQGGLGGRCPKSQWYAILVAYHVPVPVPSIPIGGGFLPDQRSAKWSHVVYLDQPVETSHMEGKRQSSGRLRCNRLYGHVNGTTLAPPKYTNREVKRTVVGNEAAGSTAGNEIRIEYETVDNPEHELWMAHDQSLVAYIISTLSEEVLGSIDDDLTTLELWTTLATTYSQVSEARFLQLRRQFQDIKHGTRSVLEYLNEIKNVSDQLAAIGHPVSDKDKVQQALSGLGAEFDIFCTALEVLPILPSFEDLKAKLFQHEASRIQRHSVISNNHNVLITGTHTPQGNRTRSWTPQTGVGRGILSTPPAINATSRRVPTCFYCNKKGHVKSECWHNPQNKGNQLRHENKAAAGSTSSSSNPTSNVPADVQQLLMTALSKLNLKQNDQGEWYVDSGAATHVTGETDLQTERRVHIKILTLSGQCREEGGGGAGSGVSDEGGSGGEMRHRWRCFDAIGKHGRVGDVVEKCRTAFGECLKHPWGGMCSGKRTCMLGRRLN
ncbi:Retrovirus-related Pol polyprotein from transposon TNT 1-94 [Nymphaea thermarum]|nr:Retrovirus-related Pol polyprotein from transposon TNT 1-94 [Nymphaea thermarum]